MGFFICCPVCIIIFIHHISRFECLCISSHRRNFDGGPLRLCHICFESFFDILSKLFHSLQNSLIHFSLIVWWNIQKQRCIVPNGVKVHITQFFHTLLRILLGSPEPTRCNTCICFRNGPLISIFKSYRITSNIITVDCICFIIHC